MNWLLWHDWYIVSIVDADDLVLKHQSISSNNTDQHFYYAPKSLTLKHRETHGCVVSTVATDALVLKHQAISSHNAD